VKGFNPIKIGRNRLGITENHGGNMTKRTTKKRRQKIEDIGARADDRQ
jgi:hypothetical protein